MAQPKDVQRFTEIEYCLTRYFNCHILPVMKQEKDALNSAQAKEIAEYSRSFAGFMRSFALPAWSMIFGSVFTVSDSICRPVGLLVISKSVFEAFVKLVLRRENRV